MRKQTSKEATVSAEWPYGVKMTCKLARAIGVMQEASKNGEALFLAQAKVCRRYAKKYGWDELYFAQAVEWCAVEAAKAVCDAHRRHERIKNADAFLWARLSQALKHNAAGKLIIPRYRIEWRHGSDVEVSYSDEDLHIQEDFAHAAR